MNIVPVALTFHDVSFSYPHLKVLDDVSFHFHQGEFIALVGPNGSGKSTMLKLVLGLESPQTGTIKLLGDDPVRNRTLVGYVPQHASYDPTFPISVLEVVKMGCIGSLGRGNKQKNTEQALKALEQVEMKELADRPYNALSGGQRRRVLVARALAAEPAMLILDEPAANLDRESEQRLYTTLGKLKGSTTIMIVTHDMRIVSSLIDRVFCLDAHKEGKKGRTIVQHTLEDEMEGETKRVRHDVKIPADYCEYPAGGKSE